MSRVPFSLRVAMVALGSLLALPLGSWALPEVDIRSATGGGTVSANPGTPGAFLTTSYQCPALGRIHVVVTGRLQQPPAPHFQTWFTQLSISRNSTTHAPGAGRLYDAPGAFDAVSAADEQDVALQHLATCEAGQTVTYRLLANKAEAAQPSPALRDAILSLMYIAISSPNGG